MALVVEFEVPTGTGDPLSPRSDTKESPASRCIRSRSERSRDEYSSGDCWCCCCRTDSSSSYPSWLPCPL